MKRIPTIKMNKVSKKRLRTLFKPRFIDDRKELHLISLGMGGGITEKIDGQYFAVRMSENGKIDVRTAKTSYEDDTTEQGHVALLEEMRSNMFMDLFKVKKKYGEFEFDGEIIYAPQEYYDDDDTVTIVATKYHRVRLGLQGAIVIRNFKTTKDLPHYQIDDVMKLVQMYFNIYRNFKCYLNDEFIVNEEVDKSVDVPNDCELSDIPKIFDKLAENDKSMFNGKLDVKGCEVEGYVFYVEGVPYAIINKRWKALKEKYLEKFNEVAMQYEEMMNGDKENIDSWIEDCIDFLSDENVPRGVRFTKRQRLHFMLGKLGQKFNVSLGDYIKMVNKLLCNPSK